MVTIGTASYTGTAARILDVAEVLVQTRGFNGFSYADIAAEMNITKAALHYHFAGKAELGEALISRYAARFADALAAVDSAGARPYSGSSTPTRPGCRRSCSMAGRRPPCISRAQRGIPHG